MRDHRASVKRLAIGEIVVSSGCLLLADPQYIGTPLAIEQIPLGKWLVIADVIRCPRGQARVAAVFFQFGRADGGALQEIGHVPIDSAKMVAIDRNDYDTYWREIGPDRIGVVNTARDKRVVALLKKHFNLDCVQADAIRAQIVQPVSPDMEDEINRLLQSIPQYAQFPYMHFYVQTNNTFDRVNWMPDRWGMIELDSLSNSRLLAFGTGYGDGTYPVFGQINNKGVSSLEVRFIEEAEVASANGTS
jgi:hypothetical protein